MSHNYDVLILLFDEIFCCLPARAKAESIRTREARFYSALHNCIKDALAYIEQSIAVDERGDTSLKRAYNVGKQLRPRPNETSSQVKSKVNFI